jgi:CHAD domain-containing protein
VPAKKISGNSPRLSLASSLKRALKRVRAEQARAAKHLATEPVHDLRVALRRCRSLAEGFSEINPHSDWRHLEKACKNLLDGLAELRDGQVMQEWSGRLGFDKGSSAEGLKKSLENDQRRARRDAHKVRAHFSRKRWKRWRRSLPERAERVAAPEAQFARLALHRLKKARELENDWRIHKNGKAAHRLRIGLKRFRYTVETFLPELAAWSAELKTLQDDLGDIHDLDVLRQRMLPLLRAESLRQQKEKWLAKIESTRSKAVDDYWRAIVVKPARGGHGAQPRTVWDRWEKGLAKLAGITFPILEEPSGSKAKPGLHAASRSSRSLSKPRRLSAAG